MPMSINLAVDVAPIEFVLGKPLQLVEFGLLVLIQSRRKLGVDVIVSDKCLKLVGSLRVVVDHALAKGLHSVKLRPISGKSPRLDLEHIASGNLLDKLVRWKRWFGKCW